MMSRNETIPYSPSEAEKARALADVYYELQQVWASSHLSSNDPLVTNAFVESYLVHVRVLLDFFERRQRSTFRDGSEIQENDDVLSADFGFAPRPIDLARIYRERLNKDLVHLAYARGHRLAESRGWPKGDVVIPIVARGIELIDFMGNRRLAPSPGISLADWMLLRERLEELRRAFQGSRTDT